MATCAGKYFKRLRKTVFVCFFQNLSRTAGRMDCRRYVFSAKNISSCKHHEVPSMVANAFFEHPAATQFMVRWCNLNGPDAVDSCFCGCTLFHAPEHLSVYLFLLFEVSTYMHNKAHPNGSYKATKRRPVKN